MMCQCFIRIFLRFGVAELWVVTNGETSFACFVLLQRAFFRSANLTSVSQYFLNERLGVATVDRLCVQSLVCQLRNASPFIKPFLQFKGWQSVCILKSFVRLEMCVEVNAPVP